MPAESQSSDHRRMMYVENFIANGGNASQAAVAAGYSANSAKVIACRLMKRQDVRDAIAARQHQVMAKIGLSAERWAEEMAAIGHVDPAEVYDAAGNLIPIKDLPPHVRRAIASVKSVNDGTEYKFHDKNAALANIGKHLGMFEQDNRQKANDIQVLIKLVG